MSRSPLSAPTGQGGAPATGPSPSTDSDHSAGLVRVQPKPRRHRPPP